jgi:NitT/TauT family transport system permease protein
MVGGSTGLGSRLTYYSSLIRIPQFFACIVLLAATGIGLYVFWSWVARRWASWDA